MGLSNYKPESRLIELKGGSFNVEGLSIEDVSVLVREHLPDLDALFEIFQNANIKTSDELLPVVKSIVSQAPGFAANLIAIASREPDSAAQASRIPAPKQIEIIMTIGDMTFTEVGGIKKSWELIAGLLKANRPRIAQMMAKVE
jgi:hypothetical protein